MSDSQTVRSKFRFLNDEDLSVLPPRARMDYYVRALAELNERIARMEPPPTIPPRGFLRPPEQDPVPTLPLRR